jgi:hypothetical protein
MADWAILTFMKYTNMDTAIRLDFNDFSRSAVSGISDGTQISVCRKALGKITDADGLHRPGIWALSERLLSSGNRSQVADDASLLDRTMVLFGSGLGKTVIPKATLDRLDERLDVTFHENSISVYLLPSGSHWNFVFCPRTTARSAV